MSQIRDLVQRHPDHQAHGILAIDSGYMRPLLDAIQLVVSDEGRVALIDTGTVHSVPQVLATLEQIGLQPDAVDWICVTHVHLDHAGGAGALAAVLPQARVAVHPRGARHLVDPSKLWAGTIAVYGEENATRLYGGLQPVPESRLVEINEGDEIRFGSRKFAVLDTPGHARHHVCYWDSDARALFTGDTFGLCYRELRDGVGRSHIFATTTPVHFDPPALHASIDRLLALNPEAIYPTHYSRATDVPRLGARLKALIDAHVAATEGIDPHAPDAHALLVEKLSALVLDEASTQAWGLQGEAALDLLAGDLDLNAQGLLVWMQSH
ncbi:MAG: MBL fold metallo-hydrolase [Betaproteobacteria bacterium]|nr:MBL fold metallo-hydrolase [Betaproteobacteria bacterium]